MPECLLEVRKLRKSFGGIVANDGIDIDVAHGSIVGLIGPNGSGKTTLFNSIAGVHPIDGGTIRFDGRPLGRLGVTEVARLGLARTFQQASIFEGMTCLQNMQISVCHAQERVGALLGTLTGGTRAKALDLLAFVGLEDRHAEPAGNLSYGQRKLLELAMALMNDPRVLLLDEPTAGVHPSLIDLIIERLRSVRRTLGTTLFVIEHNMRVVMDLADHVYCLAHGEVLAEGPPLHISRDARVIDVYLGAR